MSDEVRVYKCDDPGYRKDIADHQGLTDPTVVINIDSRAFAKLHEACCRTLAKWPHGAKHVTHEHPKVVASTASAALNYAHDHGLTVVTARCCNPLKVRR